MNNINNFNGKCFFFGDANINILNDDKKKKNILDIYTSNNFSLCNEKIPTKCGTRSATLIDHILTNKKEELNLSVIENSLTDHKIQILSTTYEEKRKSAYHVTHFKYYDRKKLRNELLTFQNLMKNSNELNILYDKLLYIFHLCTHSNTIRNKREYKIWFTSEIAKLIKVRDKKFGKRNIILEMNIIVIYMTAEINC